eukprot:scaffold120790_cov15-Prasinocladus_malaysianus.AAC.1
MECVPQADAGPGEINPNKFHSCRNEFVLSQLRQLLSFASTSLCTHLEPALESGHANVRRPVTLIWTLPGARMPGQCFIQRRLHKA